MTEFRIDQEKYRGMSPQEAQAAMAEDEREAINSHPAVVAARERLEEREREEAAEEKRQANEARRQREADAEEMWQSEYERRMMLWTASGGAESDFDAAWPEIRHKLLLERVSGDEDRRRRAAFDGFRF